VPKLFRRINKRKQKTKTDTQPTPDIHTKISSASTTPLTAEQLAEIALQAQRIEPNQLIVGIGRNCGRQRERNEDAVFAHTSTIAAASTTLPFGIYVVADGMGGHKYGDKASEIAARTMGDHLIGRLHSSLFGPQPSPPNEALQEIMRMGFYHAHQNITKLTSSGGTTLTAVLIIGTQMTIAHVGDSRAYGIFLDGRMQLLTRDHSLVKRLEELGQISPEEAALHPQKSMLYRALGQGDAPEPDVFTASLPHPGYLLICSDGLWGVISEDDMFSIISEAPSPPRACQNLIDAANAAGGPDNITVILVRMSD
jgi:serine/threonine protein phosphatase PrpC